MTLVLIGPHGAGKSTLGRLVSDRMGWAYNREIGEVLRREVLERDPDAHAALSQPEFDRTVIERELERDRLWVGRGPRIVETWHPGNLAYARRRSPGVAETYARSLSRRCREVGPIWVQPVTASAAVLADRLSEPGPEAEILGFFRSVAEGAEQLAESWGLQLLPPIDTGSCAPEESAEAIVQRLRGGLP